MNPSDFIEILQHIGYPRADNLQPQSLEWACELDKTAPFLSWFCTSVGQDNYISLSETDEYKHIQETGNAVTGSQLDEALSLLGDNTTESDAANLECNVSELRESLTRARMKKSILMARCSKLRIHHMALGNKVQQLSKVEEIEKKSFSKMMDVCCSQNEKIASSMHSLTESIQKLINMYDMPSQDQSEQCEFFLTMCNIGEFLKAEETFSHELTAFTKTQFFEGIANMTGQEQVENFDLVDLSSPEKIAELSDLPFSEDCKEFLRLQQIFPKSECDQINALVGATKASCALNEALTILHALKSNKFPTLATEISRLHHLVEQDIDSAKAISSSLVTQLPNLIAELGGLQGTEILSGDYDLKLQRQNYLIQKQNKIIELLITQRARNEFLVMLYELELHCHKEIHHLLSAARQILEINLKSWQQRMKDLEDPDLSVKRLEHNVVDTRDKSSIRLNDLLGTLLDNDRMMYLPKQKVVEKAKQLDSQYNSAKISEEIMETKYLTKVSHLESCIKESMSVLYNGSSTSSGQPILSPPELQSAMAELVSIIEKLESDIAKIVTDVHKKKTALKNNLLLNKERELFILFHTDPSQLQYVINGLTDKLRVQNIK